MKTREVAIGREQLAAMLNGERRQMCVSRQVPAGPHLLEQVEKDRGVPIAGFEDDDLRLGQPGAHLVAG